MTKINELMFSFMFIEEDLYYMEQSLKRNDEKRASYYNKCVQVKFKAIKECLIENKNKNVSKKDGKFLLEMEERNKEALMKLQKIKDKYLIK